MSAATMPATQNGTSHATAANPFNIQISKEQFEQALKKYQQMRKDNVSEDDPDFKKTKTILSIAAEQKKVMDQRRAYQQSLQAQQTQQNLAGLSANGNGLKSPLTATGGQNGDASTADGDNAPAQVDGQATDPSQNMVITKEQAAQLRQQMFAYKLLVKSAPIPPEIQRAVFPSQRQKRSPTPKDINEVATQVVEDVANGLPIADKENAPELRVWETYRDPYDLIRHPISYLEHSRRENRKQIPSIMPPGVDVERTRIERENIVYNRLQSRKNDLEKLHPNIAVWNTADSDTPEPNDSIKMKALLEYKKLCLLEKQRRLRAQIAKEIVQMDSLAMTTNRANYRRPKRQNVKEAKATERLEIDQRSARETKEKQKHSDRLRAILEHGEEVQRAARDQRSRIQRLGRMMMNQHQTIERDEQKRVERAAKQRLQALKANDEETYLKLLGQAKDSRISHLLKQTDGFLKQLAASVKSQQRNTAEKYGQADLLPEEDTSEDEDVEEGEGKKQVDYYEVAHRIKEEVTAQPSNLVGGTLKEYQLKGLQWMISLYNNNLNGILADEMGLGKTIQTISLITYLVEKKRQHGPVLVIVPLSTLTNWNNEFEKWAPTIQRIVYKGPPNVRKQTQQQIRSGQFQVLLTTYEFIIKDRPILSKVKWLYMIVDEGHRMKNSQSRLSSTITHYYQTRYRIILTGTPLQNNLPELWALLNFVLPNIFKSVKSFDEWFNTPFANTGGQDRMELTEEESLLVIRRLHKVLRPFLLRRLKRDVEKDLPDKQERVIKCTLSALQAKLYKQLFTTNKMTIGDGKGGKQTMRGLSNVLMQLRKLCNHPFVFEEVEDQMNPERVTNDLLWRTSGKFELLDRILPKFRATGHRVLIFFQMTQIMNIMEDFMRWRGFRYLRLDGGTKSDERADLLKDFNAEGSPYFCFLLSTRAGGLGLNLQSADTVIIFDSDWNPHQDLQAQDRAHRIGQKNEVRILRLISTNSVEEKILERAQFKLDMDGKVIQAGKFDNKSTEGEREAMLRVMLESAEAAESVDTIEMEDDDLNMLMMRSDDEMEVFQRLDQERARHPLYGPGKKYPRLLSEAELPDIFLTEENPAVDEAVLEETYGRGARERTRIKYDDGLTEEQWLDAVDNSDDNVDDAIARKQARKARKADKLEKKAARESVVDGETPPPVRESSESPAPRKRGRKPKVPSAEKRKVDEASLDSEVQQPRKRGRIAKVPETLSSSERNTIQTVLEKAYQALMDLQEDSEEYGSRDVIDAFIDLVPRDQYPDYYAVISNPICMSMIQKKINRKEYQSLDGFADDIRLLCANCRIYNEDGSVLYQDANNIEDTTMNILRAETSAHPSLGAAAFTDNGKFRTPHVAPASTTAGSRYGDDNDGFDGSSTGLVSGMGTPAPAMNGGGTKLKLNFGGTKRVAQDEDDDEEGEIDEDDD